MSGEDVEDHVGDDSEGDPFRNAVGKRHGDDGDIGRDGFAEVTHVDLGHGGEHQKAHDDQSGSGGEGRNGHEEGGEEQGEQEQHGHGDGGESGTSSFRNPGCTFHEGGDGTGPQEGSGAGGAGIGHQGSFDVGQLAFFVQHIAFGGDPDEGAQGIKGIHEQEGEDDGKEVQAQHMGEVQLQEQRSRADGGKGSQTAGQVGEYAEGPQFRIGHVQASGFADHAQDPGPQDAEEDVPPDVFDDQEGREQDPQHGDEHGDPHAVEGAVGHSLGEGIKGDLRSRVGHDDPGIQQSDEGDEEPDPYRNGLLQGHGDGIEDGFPDGGQGKDDEDDPFDEDGGQGHFPGIPHLEADGVGKVGVEPHARCQGKGIVGKGGHEEGTQGRGDGGDGEQGPFIHACGTEDGGVHDQDVGHGHECGDPGDDFRPHGGVVFLQMEDLFAELFHDKLPFFQSFKGFFYYSKKRLNLLEY